MIKVCIISLGSYPLFNPTCKRTFGGSEVQLFLLARELEQHPEIDVHFIVGDFGQEKIEEYGRITVYKGMPIKRHQWLTRFFPRTKILLFNLMHRIQADIIIQRTASAGTGFIAVLSHFWRKKFIYMTAHEIDCNGGFEKQNSWLAGKFFQYGIRHADVVITQSSEHAEMIRTHHKVESIIMPSLYVIPSEEELAHIEKKSILWVGRCEDWKRPEVFIDLAREHPEEQFIMISPQPNNQSTYYLVIQEQLKNAPKNLTHIPYVPFTKIDQYFKEAKLFINTSTYEGFPNTFIQAAKNKTPILSLAVNPDGVLEREQCGSSAHDDIEILKQTLTAYLRNPNQLQLLGENGYMYAKARHSSTKIVLEYTQLFKKMLNRTK